MNEIEACLQLNVSKDADYETIEESCLSETFKIKDYFIRNHVVKKVFSSKIQRLDRFQEAINVLLDEGIDENIEHYEALNSLTDDDLIQSYEKAMMQMKFKLSQAQWPGQVAYFANKMVELQEEFETVIYQKYYSYLELFLNDKTQDSAVFKEVRLSQAITSVELKKILNQPQPSTNIVLLKEVYRIHKIKNL